MLDIEGSLKYRGKAVVVQDKADDEHTIAIVPIELSGEFDGEYDGEEATRHSKYVDRLGNVLFRSCDFGTHVYARWYKSSNRRTSPNVTAGETVHLYEFEDTRVWFWKEDPRTDHYRCLEEIEFLLSNVSDRMNDPEHLTGRTARNAYSLLWSTKQKLLQYKTNKFDGEAFEHVLQVDSASSVMRYKDDAGMLIEADSASDKITLRNHAGTSVELDGNSLYIYAPSDVNVECKNAKVEAKQLLELIAKELKLDCMKISSTALEVDFSKADFTALLSRASHPPALLPPKG